jgi:diguanylate cyclase (GGDEF)-like protein
MAQDIAIEGFDPAADLRLFDLAPVSLWLEDYSALKRLFEDWRAAGVENLRAFLGEDVGHVEACSQAIRVLAVNARTLELFKAADCAELVANLSSVFRDEMMSAHIDELVQLWDGARSFRSATVNYALDGRRLDVRLAGTIMPGHEETWERVLIAIEDVTEQESERRRRLASESHARGLFEHSPVSLWVEDFSRIRALMERVRAQGIVDFRVFTDVHPEFVTECMSEIRVLDVNRQTLQLFGAPDKKTLLMRLPDVFRDGMHQPFREQLIDLWNGKLFQTREVVNYSLDGNEIHVLLQFSVLPGHEADWSMVQVALTDITARKKAEAYLEYLGRHDVLTKLYNRSFYVDEMNRLERKRVSPISIVVADLNGLKAANDRYGHAAGDALLRRAGEVLGKAGDVNARTARIGGDEFALLLPYTDERGAALLIAQLQDLVHLNNQFYPGLQLSMSFGAATGRDGERLESVARRADMAMYAAKTEHYLSAEPPAARHAAE